MHPSHVSHHCSSSSHASRREEHTALLLSLTGSMLNHTSELSRLSLSLLVSLSVTHRFLSVVWLILSSFSSALSLRLSAAFGLSNFQLSWMILPPTMSRYRASCLLLALQFFGLWYLTLKKHFSWIPPTSCGHADNYGFCLLSTKHSCVWFCIHAVSQKSKCHLNLKKTRKVEEYSEQIQ